ncbi:MAG TPA: hypothetical protein PKW33_08495 [Anaerolineaceae bacterium]|nr:hypothetical protein [Anaerolineaceae bacterium]HPN51613.1 hypothetical protein [Anaerolineaceae bacterium]
MRGRFGCFFLLLGVILLTVFFASDIARSPDFMLALAGIGALLMGWGLWHKRTKAEQASAQRFTTMRRLFGKNPPPKPPQGK